MIVARCQTVGGFDEGFPDRVESAGGFDGRFPERLESIGDFGRSLPRRLESTGDFGRSLPDRLESAGGSGRDLPDRLVEIDLDPGRAAVLLVTADGEIPARYDPATVRWPIAATHTRPERSTR